MLSLSKHLYRAFGRNRTARPRYFVLLSMACCLAGMLPAHAQRPAAPHVYTYVEQMPQLPGGGGEAAIMGEVMKRMRLPAIDMSKDMRCSGIKFTFVVDTTGAVRDAVMVVGSKNQAVDKAILDAVRSLPRLQPGRQAGRPVSVRLTMPISCLLVR